MQMQVCAQGLQKNGLNKNKLYVSSSTCHQICFAFFFLLLLLVGALCLLGSPSGILWVYDVVCSIGIFLQLGKYVFFSRCSHTDEFLTCNSHFLDSKVLWFGSFKLQRAFWSFTYLEGLLNLQVTVVFLIS